MENEDLYKDLRINPFKVPDGYFEKFDSTVMDRLYGKGKGMGVWRNAIKWGIAASIFIAAGVSIFLYSNEGENVGLKVSDLSEIELARFYNNVEISDDELIDLVSTHKIDSIYQVEIVLNARNSDKSETGQSVNIEEEYSPLDEEGI